MRCSKLPAAYSREGVVVARAGSFQAALSARREDEFEPQTLVAFFRSALRSHNGEYKFDARSPVDLSALAERYRATTSLLVSGEAPPEPRRRAHGIATR